MSFYYDSIEKNIRYRRCFLADDPATPGFQRFVSADLRFPISISCPRNTSPFYDFNQEHYLHVDFSASSGDIAFSVRRENLNRAAGAGDRAAAAVLLRQEDLYGLMEEEFDRRKRAPRHIFGDGGHVYDVGGYRVTKKPAEFVPVGQGGFRAPKVVWHTRPKKLGGEWVFFQGKQEPVLWTITWNAEAGHGADVFARVLASFRWLGEAFFRSLPR